MKTYRWTCILNGILFIYMTMILLLNSDGFITDLGLVSNETSILILRRAAMFMLGVSVISLLTCNTKDCKTRMAVSLGYSLTMLGLATTGIHAWCVHVVGSGIAISIIIETLLGLSFLYCFLKNRK